MKLINTVPYCKNNFPTRFEDISRCLKQAEGAEEKTLIYVLANTVACLSIGMVYNIISYALSGVLLLLAANLVLLAVYIVAMLRYAWGKSTISVTLAVLLFAAQANTCISIFHNYAFIIGQNRFMTTHDIFQSFLVCILAAMSMKKNQVFILCALFLATIAAIIIIHSPVILIQRFPRFCLAYLTSPVLLTYTRIFLWKTLGKTERMLSEKKAPCQLTGMSESQWDLLIDIMQKPHAPRSQTAQLFEQIQEAIGDRLVVQAERLLASEELLGRINGKYNFSFTANEVRLCCLILEDKSIKDISRILYINESSVRANRSRIRKKMKLDKKTNLKAYLLMLVGEEKNSCGDNFKGSDGVFSK